MPMILISFLPSVFARGNRLTAHCAYILQPEDLYAVSTCTSSSSSHSLLPDMIGLSLAVLMGVLSQHNAKLPAQFWADAVKTACYLRNRTPIGPD